MLGPFQTLLVRDEGAVLFVSIAAPPLNLIGPELVRDLVDLIQQAEADDAVRVIVFKSADPDYFIAHVDLNRVAEYRDSATKLAGEPSLGLLFRYLSASRLITIAQIEGRAGGAGSEFALACDMRFAARGRAIFRHMEPAFGWIEGAGGVQHLTRLMGRGRALEVLMSGQDYDADLAERYGWVNRALPLAELDAFVSVLAHRLAGFPPMGLASIKARVNDIALAPADEFRRDSMTFLENLREPASKSRVGAAFERGFQTREGEMDLAAMLGDLPQSYRTASAGPRTNPDAKGNADA
jgi:enoyl-CoA hydratase/carnithine racemase